MQKLKEFVKKPAAILCASLLLVSLICVLWTVSSPAPRDTDYDGFSAERVYAHLEQIAQHPHSVFEQTAVDPSKTALDDVRSYIAHEISALGLQAERVRYTNLFVNNIGTTPVTENVEIPVENIYAEIPGKSGTFMLLMAHYDSCPAKIKNGIFTADSFGAGDDGYGVGTLLEIMNLLVKEKKAGKVFENGVKFVFTDAEEVALGGAAALVYEDAARLNNVNLVINVEARGMRGPLFMFQTSPGNKELINLFRKARAPFGFSVASDVYAILESDTDFSPFLAEGYAGLNFSTLNSMREYHTPEDNLGNVNKSVLQEYGDQLYPVITEYVSDAKYSAPDYFLSGTDSVFFTVLPFLFISYSQIASWIFIALLFVGAGFAIYFAVKKRAVNLKKALLALGLWFSFIFASAAAGLLLSLLFGLIFGVKFNIMNMAAVPFDLGFLLIFAAGIFTAAFFAAKLFRRLGCETLDIYAGFLFVLLALTLLTALFLHGGTYLFLWPAALMTGYLAARASGTAARRWKYLRYALSSLALALSFILYSYLVYSLFLAITFGGMVAHLLFAAVMGGLLIMNCQGNFIADSE